MLPAHFVFAADQEHTVIALLIYLKKMSPKKKKSSFPKLPVKKKTPVKNNKKPGLVGIVDKLTSVAMAQQQEKGDDTPVKKMPVKSKKKSAVGCMCEGQGRDSPLLL